MTPGPAWPALNACLNAASALLLVAGYGLIRRGWRGAHGVAMAAASACSLAFFVSYVLYHAQVGSVRFPRGGWIRAVYFTVLVSHTILAIVSAPLVARTLWLALRRRFDAHRAIARLTLPLWLYVSVTGVVVYWMLYQL